MSQDSQCSQEFTISQKYPNAQRTVTEQNRRVSFQEQDILENSLLDLNIRNGKASEDDLNNEREKFLSDLIAKNNNENQDDGVHKLLVALG